MNKSRPNKITFRLSDSELQDLRSRVEKSGFNELLGKENICPNINVALEKAKAIIEK